MMAIEIGSFSLGFIAGGIIVGFFNHLLAKSRDGEKMKNEQFNKSADNLYEILIKEKNNPSPRSNIDFSMFRRELNSRQRIRFDKCVDDYRIAIKKSKIDYPWDVDDSLQRISSGFYRDPSLITESIDRILSFTKRK